MHSRTDFAAKVPQFERAVVAPRDDASVVQQEASGEDFPAVTRQRVLPDGQKDTVKRR